MASLLCALGIHKWGKPVFFDQTGSNVLEYKKKCGRCGKVVKWIKAK